MAIDPNSSGFRRMFSVTLKSRRNNVPRLIIRLFTLNQLKVPSGNYDSAAAGEMAVTRIRGMTGSKALDFSSHLNNELSKPVDTAARHLIRTP